MLKNHKEIKLADPIIGRREIRAVTKVLRSGNLAQGSLVARFELEFSRFVEDRNCIAVNSGTSALITALMALEIGPGDEVIVPSFTFAATANSVFLVGAKPVFVDIDSKTFNIDPDKVAEAITDKTKAIMVVHLYGLAADMPRILDIAEKHSLLVIEDAAQAHLAKIHNKAVGTFGHAAAFSFYPTKNMTSAEGGMVVIEDPSVARRARLLRNQGMEKRYENEIPGFNFRMTELHAAIGIEQLKKLESWTRIRQDNAQIYDENLSQIAKQETPEGYEHVFHQYTISVPHYRDYLLDELRRLNIGSAIYYPTQVHRLASFNENIDLPVTESATKSVLSIPVHPRLSARQIKKVSHRINSILGDL
jgi:dTDP-4-amino-4,6-dideoxygalactose transaminase